MQCNGACVVWCCEAVVPRVTFSLAVLLRKSKREQRAVQSPASSTLARAARSCPPITCHVVQLSPASTTCSRALAAALLWRKYARVYVSNSPHRLCCDSRLRTRSLGTCALGKLQKKQLVLGSASDTVSPSRRVVVCTSTPCSISYMSMHLSSHASSSMTYSLNALMPRSSDKHFDRLTNSYCRSGLKHAGTSHRRQLLNWRQCQPKSMCHSHACLCRNNPRQVTMRTHLHSTTLRERAVSAAFQKNCDCHGPRNSLQRSS